MLDILQNEHILLNIQLKNIVAVFVFVFVMVFEFFDWWLDLFVVVESVVVSVTKKRVGLKVDFAREIKDLLLDLPKESCWRNDGLTKLAECCCFLACRTIVVEVEEGGVVKAALPDRKPREGA